MKSSNTIAGIFLVLVLTACSNQTPADLDLANFPNQAEYTVSPENPSESLCNILSREELSSIVGFSLNSEANPSLLNQEFLKECHYSNNENQFSLAMIAHYSTGQQTAAQQYLNNQNSLKSDLKAKLQDLNYSNLIGIYYSTDSQTTTFDIKFPTAWLNFSISGGNTSEHLKMAKSIIDLAKEQF